MCGVDSCVVFIARRVGTLEDLCGLTPKLINLYGKKTLHIIVYVTGEIIGKLTIRYTNK